MSTKTKSPSKKQLKKELREELEKLDPQDIPAVKAFVKAKGGKQKFIPVTQVEVHDYNFRFAEWLETVGGKAAVQAFYSIQLMQIYANHQATELGQKQVRKTRSNLTRFFDGIKK
jgi:hypothetical protein